MAHKYLKFVRESKIGRIILTHRKFECLIGQRCYALVIARLMGSATCVVHQRDELREITALFGQRDGLRASVDNFGRGDPAGDREDPNYGLSKVQLVKVTLNRLR